MIKRAKHIQKYILRASGLLLALFILSGIVAITPVSAQAPAKPPSSTDPNQFDSQQNICPKGKYVNDDGSPCVTPRNIQAPTTGKPSLLDTIVTPLIRLMTAIIGIVVAISLVAAAITYAGAGGDPGKVAAAKKRITNTVIALIAYIFTLGLVQWLVPGGLV